MIQVAMITPPANGEGEYPNNKLKQVKNPAPVTLSLVGSDIDALDKGEPIKIRYVPDDFSVDTSNAGSHDEEDKDAKLMREEEETFYSHSTNNHGDDNIWGLLSGVGGNIYEW